MTDAQAMAALVALALLALMGLGFGLMGVFGLPVHTCQRCGNIVRRDRPCGYCAPSEDPR